MTQHGSANILSPELETAIKQTMVKKGTGYINAQSQGIQQFYFCPSCRIPLKCRNCDVTLTFHKSESTSIRRI
jgi:primosomal protein N' (replication factor Y)